jgi:hypothetical protein
MGLDHQEFLPRHAIVGSLTPPRETARGDIQIRGPRKSVPAHGLLEDAGDGPRTRRSPVGFVIRNSSMIV